MVEFRAQMKVCPMTGPEKGLSGAVQRRAEGPGGQ
jgi:hypothetical protein